MGSNKVSNEIKAKAPPNGTKDVACDFLHSSHETDAVVHLWEELKQENDEKHCHYQPDLFFPYQFWYKKPERCLKKPQTVISIES